jgi:hypothetical protein
VSASFPDLTFDGAPDTRPPIIALGDGRVADPQAVEIGDGGLFEESQTGADFAMIVNGDDVPAILVDGELMTAPGAQLVGLNRAVIDVDRPSKPLYSLEQFVVAACADLHAPERGWNPSTHRR